MEIHHHPHTSSANNNAQYCRSSSLNMAHQYRHQGDAMVATPLVNHPWSQGLRSANVVGGDKALQQQKRDFHFQVIQVRQGPKWFILPGAQTEEKSNKPISDQENEAVRMVEPVIAPHSTANASPFGNATQFRRNSRFSNRRKFMEVQPMAVDDMLEAPNSEPTTRRMLSKPLIQVTQIPSSSAIPIVESPCGEPCSSSMPSSQTFKILSVARKNWDDSDDEDGLACSCRKMSLSLDDDCELPREAHCAAASGTSSSTCSSYQTCTSICSSSSSAMETNNNNEEDDK